MNPRRSPVSRFGSHPQSMHQFCRCASPEAETASVTSQIMRTAVAKKPRDSYQKVQLPLGPMRIFLQTWSKVYEQVVSISATVPLKNMNMTKLKFSHSQS